MKRFYIVLATTLAVSLGLSAPVLAQDTTVDLGGAVIVRPAYIGESGRGWITLWHFRYIGYRTKV